jgi:hypothetical protein
MKVLQEELYKSYENRTGSKGNKKYTEFNHK